MLGGSGPPYWPAVHGVFCTIILSSMQIIVLSPSKCDIKVAQSPLAVHPGSATVRACTVSASPSLPSNSARHLLGTTAHRVSPRFQNPPAIPPCRRSLGCFFHARAPSPSLLKLHAPRRKAPLPNSPLRSKSNFAWTPNHRSRLKFSDSRLLSYLL